MKFLFDIDGTICYTIKGDYKNSKPMNKRIEKINKLYKEGNEIIFFTATGMNRNDGSVHKCYDQFCELTLKQLREWKVKFDILIMGKPSADFYIDDKGVENDKFFGN